MDLNSDAHSRRGRLAAFKPSYNPSFIPVALLVGIFQGVKSKNGDMGSVGHVFLMVHEPSF